MEVCVAKRVHTEPGMLHRYELSSCGAVADDELPSPPSARHDPIVGATEA